MSSIERRSELPAAAALSQNGSAPIKVGAEVASPRLAGPGTAAGAPVGLQEQLKLALGGTVPVTGNEETPVTPKTAQEREKFFASVAALVAPREEAAALVA